MVADVYDLYWQINYVQPAPGELELMRAQPGGGQPRATIERELLRPAPGGTSTRRLVWEGDTSWITTVPQTVAQPTRALPGLVVSNDRDGSTQLGTNRAIQPATWNPFASSRQTTNLTPLLLAGAAAFALVAVMK